MHNLQDQRCFQEARGNECVGRSGETKDRPIIYGGGKRGNSLSGSVLRRDIKVRINCKEIHFYYLYGPSMSTALLCNTWRIPWVQEGGFAFGIDRELDLMSLRPFDDSTP
jgi:hypothetical protein